MRAKILAMVGLLLVSASMFGQAKTDNATKRLQQQKVRQDGESSALRIPFCRPMVTASDYVSTGTGPNYYLVHLKAGHSIALRCGIRRYPDNRHRPTGAGVTQHLRSGLS